MNNGTNNLKISKKIEILLLLIAIVWSGIFAVNYVKYTRSEPLLLSKHKHSDYADGYVDEYVSLGYIYRSYKRVAISKEELVPFWVKRKNPEATNSLPRVDEEYNVPDNPSKFEKYRGLLYFYSYKMEFLGTYKCINSTQGCNRATGGHDIYDTLNKDPYTRVEPHSFDIIYDKFAFIDDSQEQEVSYGEPGYNRTIYLYKFLDDEREILARYADIKESKFDDVKEKAIGDNNRYIVKNYDNFKWGLIKIEESGSIQEVLPFEYESISYDIDTGYYILCKDESWYVYDLNNKSVVSATSIDPIFDVWRNNNNTYYFKTGRDRSIGKEEFTEYSIYRMDGQPFLKVDRATEVIPKDSYIMYITSTDNKLHFYSYGGEEKYAIQLHFSNMDHSDVLHPAFEVLSERNGMLVLKVYLGRELKYDYDTESINTNNWAANYE